MSDSDLDARVAWQRHLGRSAASTAWFESVLTRHCEPQRHYHDVRHVRWVVRHVQSLATGRDLDDPGAVVAAAFFHDVVYDPTSAGNEDASAALAVNALAELDWPADRIDAVVSMIEATTHHDVGRIDDRRSLLDHAVLFAADLAVLAAEPAGYSDYSRNVRREYRHVSDLDWVAGRCGVLRSFLERNEIYAPALGLVAWEQRARGNITAELDELARSG